MQADIESGRQGAKVKMRMGCRSVVTLDPETLPLSSLVPNLHPEVVGLDHGDDDDGDDSYQT